MCARYASGNPPVPTPHQPMLTNDFDRIECHTRRIPKLVKPCSSDSCAHSMTASCTLPTSTARPPMPAPTPAAIEAINNRPRQDAFHDSEHTAPGPRWHTRFGSFARQYWSRTPPKQWPDPRRSDQFLFHDGPNRSKWRRQKPSLGCREILSRCSGAPQRNPPGCGCGRGDGSKSSPGNKRNQEPSPAMFIPKIAKTSTNQNSAPLEQIHPSNR